MTLPETQQGRPDGRAASQDATRAEFKSTSTLPLAAVNDVHNPPTWMFDADGEFMPPDLDLEREMRLTEDQWQHWWAVWDARTNSRQSGRGGVKLIGGDGDPEDPRWVEVVDALIERDRLEVDRPTALRATWIKYVGCPGCGSSGAFVRRDKATSGAITYPAGQVRVSCGRRCRTREVLAELGIETVPEPHVMEWDGAGQAPAGPDEQSAGRLHTVTVQEFAAVDEPGAEPLLGDHDQALIPEGGDIMMYGDGGAGKTTLAVDLAIHWAAGDDWLGIPITRPLNLLVIENEGPRPLLRKKIARKITGWTGSTPGDRARIVDEPWAQFTFDDPNHRQMLADLIVDLDLDVVIVGPIVAAGMNEAGTLQETREFQGLLGNVRHRARRRVAFVLIHHENRAGKVSGAWEGTGDTLLHVTGMGHGRTRLHIQKARWATNYHATTLELVWTDNEGFAVDDTPEVTDDDLAERILTAVAENPGTGWTKVERALGVRRDRSNALRDRLLETGRLVNIVKVDGTDRWLTECLERRPSRLYPPEDPTIRHLLPGPGADGEQTAPATGERVNDSAPLLPVRSRGADGGADSTDSPGRSSSPGGPGGPDLVAGEQNLADAGLLPDPGEDGAA